MAGIIEDESSSIGKIEDESSSIGKSAASRMASIIKDESSSIGNSAAGRMAGIIEDESSSIGKIEDESSSIGKSAAGRMASIIKDESSSISNSVAGRMAGIIEDESSSIGNSAANIEDEIDVAFATRAMPLEWRRMLLASGMDEDDIQLIAAAIHLQAHPKLQCIYSKHNIVFKAAGFLWGLFVCLIALLLLKEDKSEKLVVLLWGLFTIAMTAICVVVDECDRRCARGSGRKRELSLSTLCRRKRKLSSSTYCGTCFPA